MKPATQHLSLPYANVGYAAWGELVAHYFVDDSKAPICMPRVAGAPAQLHNADRVGLCKACDKRLVCLTWSATTFRKKTLWVVPAVPSAPPKRPEAVGIATDIVEAFAQVRDAIERLYPGDVPVLLRRASDRDAERLARERRAEERLKKISDGDGAQVVEHLYRHHQRFDWGRVTFDGTSVEDFVRYMNDRPFTWEREAARVLRKTAKRMFIENTLETYETASGVLVSKTYSLDRQEIERTGKGRWGWTTGPNPPAEAKSGPPAWATTLGLSWPCTAQEAKAAFRRAAKAAHPDAGGSAEQFQTVKKAYDAACSQLGAS